MIVIEPPQPPGTTRRDAISKRELSRFLVRAIESVGLCGTVSVLLTDDAQIRRLNREFRHKDQATDVLSFPAADFGASTTDRRAARLAGDLAVSLETAARQAEVFGHALELEVKILLLHGLLHLAGFDHENDAGQMARRESRLRKQLELPTGLIQRASGPGASGSLNGHGNGHGPTRAGKTSRLKVASSKKAARARPKTQKKSAAVCGRRAS